MVFPLRKLFIAVFAVLAFSAGNFAMVSSGMGHDGGLEDQHVAVVACAVDHAGHAAFELAGEHACQPVQKGTCDSGPTCCSSACQALVVSTSFAAFRAKIDVTEEWIATPAARHMVILLERPPRVPASA
jgi:hypothetical protein